VTVDKDIALSIYFIVTIDDKELGAWNSCEGLGAEVVIEQREEGGNNGFVWQLPTRIKYPNIKLTRPLTSDTTKVAKWLADSTGGKPTARTGTGSILALTSESKEIASWGLLDVVPVRWTGPSFNPDSPKVATETLEIAHHGFIDAKAKPSGQN
jgi:phage tail-like protein